jgi:hypothetical protein
MHRCCAVNASGGEGVIAGLNVFAVEVDGGSGWLSLTTSCRETGRFAG